MKRTAKAKECLVGFLWLLLVLVTACRPHHPAATPAGTPEPCSEAGGIQARHQPSYEYYYERDERYLQRRDVVAISFPSPMAAAANLGASQENPPVQFTPELPVKFRWVSVTQGEVTVVGEPCPETEYKLILKSGVVDMAGRPVDVPEWGLRWKARPFKVQLDGRYGREDNEREYADRISSQPAIRLRFSHPVSADEVVSTVQWRDEANNTFASDVQLVSGGDKVSNTRFDVTPQQPLAAGHRYELLVENTPCALGGVRLPYPRVFALGKTLPMKIERVGAYHQPKTGAFLAICYNQSVEPGSLPKPLVKITPDVAIRQTVVDGNEVHVFGDFKPETRYAISVAGGVRSWTGYTSEKAENWKATFQHKRAAVIVPRSVLITPATNGLNVDFLQVNTGALRWRLAEVPTESLLAVRARLDEYRDWDKIQPERNSKNRELRLNRTELLVPGLKLPVVLEGEIAASGGDEETPRVIKFAPGQIPPGMYMLEIDGPTADGRTAGNRVLVFVNREFLVWKQMPSGLGGRIFDVVTGDPVSAALLRIYSQTGELLIDTKTDEEGNFYFASEVEVFPAELALIERAGRQSAHFVPFGGRVPYFRSRHLQTQGKTEKIASRQWLFTDRRIYRPGETVKVHGIVRCVEDDGQLAVPEVGVMPWVLKRQGNDEPVMTGQVHVSATGSWDGELNLPTEMSLGAYRFEAGGTSCEVKLDEFRAPAFSVDVEPAENLEGAKSRVKVYSHTFQGAPNVRALVRWRAVWTGHVPYGWSDGKEQYLRTSDYDSPGLPLRRPYWARDDDALQFSEAEARELTYDGTAMLDNNGVAVLESSAIFPPRARLAFAQVRWEVSVVSADGQTVSAESNRLVSLKRAQPAISLKTGERGREMELSLLALDGEGEPVGAVALHVDLYRVDEKSVREVVSSHVVRYRNTPVFTRVLTREVQTPFTEKVQVEKAGRYVAVATYGVGDDAPRASTDAYARGEDRAEFAQWDDNTIELKLDRKSYRVGGTAHVALTAPFAGKCWVTVETDKILYSKLAVLEGNATGVDVPVTAAMHPNAHVAVYLFRPFANGGTAERIGSCELRVEKPDTHLELATSLQAEQVEPGAKIQGSVKVTCEGRPVVDAELTVFAVDESILRYGRWMLPDPDAVFFPHVEHQIETWSGIDQFKTGAEDEPLFQKGFLLGDGGALWRNQFVRSRFRTLAFWQGTLKTDAEGTVTFAFDAPDNLTVYRIVAVAHHGVAAFGHNEKQVRVARKLQAEPALPRFVRNGDGVDLRVIIRQRDIPQMPVRVVCTAEGANVNGPTETAIDLVQGLPQPVIFHAKVGDENARVHVRFAVQAVNDSRLRDEVELDIPVRAPTVLRRESIAGEIPAAGWESTAVMPAEWSQGKGSVDLIVSRSRWLPLLESLPSLLDYPHGCSEQVSGRVLAYALMADLLRSLPDGEKREAEYRKRVSEGLYRLSRAQLPDGGMAYWPGATEANAFVTIQSAWAVIEAQNSGFKVSAPLAEGLKSALTKIVRRQNRIRVSAPLRAFALMVAASLDPAAKPRAEALELYRQRDELGDDGCAFLALALHRFDLLPEEKKELLAELVHEPVVRVFDVSLFNSERRTSALRFCARAEIEGRKWTKADREVQQRALAALMSTSQDFSTQENLWFLLAFRALNQSERKEAVAEVPSALAGGACSRDGQAIGWYGQSLDGFAKRFSENVEPLTEMRSYYARATYRLAQGETRKDRGIRVERVVRNLTAAERDGSDKAPFRVGDELVVTFRVWSQRSHAYVALEESLPAAFETVDPEYYRTTQQRQLEEDNAFPSLRLSHWEKRDDRTLWYFDALESGAHGCSVVVRVTASGRFHWPGVTVAPMYDARFSGTGEGAVIEVQ